MAVWPLQDACCIDQGGALTASSLGTTVTSGAAHTKGAWVELIASTSAPMSELLIVSTGALFTATTDTASMFDIGFGAAAAEVVAVPDVLCGALAANAIFVWRLPIPIAQGVRVSMRFQSAVASKTMEVQAFACGGGFLPSDSGGKATTYGTVAASSSGTLLATPGTVNTEAAWTVISASTTSQARFALVTVQPVTGTSAILGNNLIDIGMGTAAAEQVIIANIIAKTDASERIQYSPMTFPVSIPEGSRLVARQQCSAVSASAVPRVAVTLFS